MATIPRPASPSRSMLAARGAPAAALGTSSSGTSTGPELIRSAATSAAASLVAPAFHAALDDTGPGISGSPAGGAKARRSRKHSATTSLGSGSQLGDACSDTSSNPGSADGTPAAGGAAASGGSRRARRTSQRGVAALSLAGASVPSKLGSLGTPPTPTTPTSAVHHHHQAGGATSTTPGGAAPVAPTSASARRRSRKTSASSATGGRGRRGSGAHRDRRNSAGQAQLYAAMLHAPPPPAAEPVAPELMYSLKALVYPDPMPPLRDAPPVPNMVTVLKRRWAYADRSSMDKNSFSVLSWNILAPTFERLSTLSSSSPPGSPTASETLRLSDAYLARRNQLATEMLYYEPDVLCLQEVDPTDFDTFFHPLLHAAGYAGHYAAKSAHDGCAMFYRRDRFALAGPHGSNSPAMAAPTVLRYRDVPLDGAPLDAPAQWHAARPADQVTRHASFANIAQIATLRNLLTGARVRVANTHLLWQPEFSDAKLLQAAILAEHLVATEPRAAAAGHAGATGVPPPPAAHMEADERAPPLATAAEYASAWPELSGSSPNVQHQHHQQAQSSSPIPIPTAGAMSSGSASPVSWVTAASSPIPSPVISNHAGASQRDPTVFYPSPDSPVAKQALAIPPRPMLSLSPGAPYAVPTTPPSPSYIPVSGASSRGSASGMVRSRGAGEYQQRGARSAPAQLHAPEPLAEEHAKPAHATPIVICGDLNSLPDSNVLRLLLTGSVPVEEFGGSQFGRFTAGAVFEHSLALRSAYEGASLPYTHRVPHFSGFIDHMLYSSAGLKLMGVLDTSEPAGHLESLYSLPTAHIPSDHLPLLSIFRATQPGNAPSMQRS